MITSWNGEPSSVPAGGGFIDRLAGSAAGDLARAAQQLQRSLPEPHDYDAWIFDFDGKSACT